MEYALPLLFASAGTFFAANSFEEPKVTEENPTNESEPIPGVGSDVLSTEAPSVEAPSYAAPSFEAPSYGAPKYEAPKYEAPKYEAPGYGAPGYGAPGYGAPGYGAPGYGAPSSSWMPSIFGGPTTVPETVAPKSLAPPTEPATPSILPEPILQPVVPEPALPETVVPSVVPEPVVSQPVVPSVLSEPVVPEPVVPSIVSQPVVSQPVIPSAVAEPILPSIVQSTVAEPVTPPLAIVPSEVQPPVAIVSEHLSPIESQHPDTITSKNCEASLPVQPMVQPAVEDVVQPVVQPMVQPAVEDVVQPVVQPPVQPRVSTRNISLGENVPLQSDTGIMQSRGIPRENIDIPTIPEAEVEESSRSLISTPEPPTHVDLSRPMDVTDSPGHAETLQLPISEETPTTTSRALDRDIFQLPISQESRPPRPIRPNFEPPSPVIRGVLAPVPPPREYIPHQRALDNLRNLHSPDVPSVSHPGMIREFGKEGGVAYRRGTYRKKLLKKSRFGKTLKK